MDISCIFFGILFIVTGLLFALGKIHAHIPAWKNTPEEEKKKINIVPLCRNVGEIVILCGVIFLIKGFLADYSGPWFVIAMIAWLVVAGIDVWFITKGNRYKNR